jgi:hypothetical protein
MPPDDIDKERHCRILNDPNRLKSSNSILFDNGRLNTDWLNRGGNNPIAVMCLSLTPKALFPKGYTSEYGNDNKINWNENYKIEWCRIRVKLFRGSDTDTIPIKLSDYVQIEPIDEGLAFLDPTEGSSLNDGLFAEVEEDYHTLHPTLLSNQQYEP